MSITTTELEENLNKYLQLSATEDIFITKNGKIIAKLSNPFEDRIQLVNSLVGIIPDTMTLEEAREERLSRI
ncbi:MAG: type II toxin-antitoxin system prevent-host-death family antitoxin [Anaerolineaceae bacterium]|nr:type II toxin-antitoxin system prevent-host-death family antitoxin [Anaerolineaceae bacterium]